MSEINLRPPERAIERRVLERTFALVEAASRWLGKSLPAPEVRFDLRGRAAGQARLWVAGRSSARGKRRRNLGASSAIRYNPVLLEENPEEFLAQTVPHEVAHLVAYALYGPRIRPHGVEWQTIVRYLGGKPERCHTYDVSGTAARRLRLFDYHCACRNHRLSSIRHRRVLAGQTYLCRSCAGPLHPGADPSLGQPEEPGGA